MEGEFVPGIALSGKDVSGACVVVVSMTTVVSVDSGCVDVSEVAGALSHALANNAVTIARATIAARGVLVDGTSAGYRSFR